MFYRRCHPLNPHANESKLKALIPADMRLVRPMPPATQMGPPIKAPKTRPMPAAAR